MSQPLHHEAEYEEEPKKGFFRSVLDQFFGRDEPETEETARPTQSTNTSTASARSQRAWSVHMTRESRVAVRLNLQNRDDAKIAIDGLSSGEHQIINLEKAKAEMRERILDTLNGACYALGGNVHQIGDKVYMYVPANVSVDAGERESQSLRRSLYDDDSL